MFEGVSDAALDVASLAVWAGSVGRGAAEYGGREGGDVFSLITYIHTDTHTHGFWMDGCVCDEGGGGDVFSVVIDIHAYTQRGVEMCVCVGGCV